MKLEKIERKMERYASMGPEYDADAGRLAEERDQYISDFMNNNPELMNYAEREGGIVPMIERFSRFQGYGEITGRNYESISDGLEIMTGVKRPLENVSSYIPGLGVLTGVVTGGLLAINTDYDNVKEAVIVSACIGELLWHGLSRAIDSISDYRFNTNSRKHSRVIRRAEAVGKHLGNSPSSVILEEPLAEMSVNG